MYIHSPYIYRDAGVSVLFSSECPTSIRLSPALFVLALFRIRGCSLRWFSSLLEFSKTLLCTKDKVDAHETRGALV